MHRQNSAELRMRMSPCACAYHTVRLYLCMGLKVYLCEPGLTLLLECFSLICLGDSAEGNF